jgi:hypothetical protein
MFKREEGAVISYETWMLLKRRDTILRQQEEKQERKGERKGKKNK